MWEHHVSEKIDLHNWKFTLTPNIDLLIQNPALIFAAAYLWAIYTFEFRSL